jgi:cation:H+ antiporter
MLDFVLLALGLAGLYFGGNWLVRGASRIARSFGMSALMVGLTIVAMGTSAPELLSSITAALKGNSDLALGNVVGSNVANIALILGVTGLIAPIVVQDRHIKRHIEIMIVATLLVALMTFDGQIERHEGVMLVVGYALYLYYTYRLSNKDTQAGTKTASTTNNEAAETGPADIKRGREIAIFLGGLIVLVIGARLTVDSATDIATAVGFSALFIGITVVAVGTSLPELTASITSARKNQTEMAVGNVVGSNIANLLLILGATAMIRPIDVPASSMRFSFLAMLFFSILLIPMIRDRQFSKRESAFLLIGYVIFIGLSVVLAQ